MPSCVLCQGKQIFYFTPKFPDHLKHIAQRLDLCVPKACPCPFCCDVQPAADYECVKQENSKAKNVSWTDEHPVEYLKGYAKGIAQGEGLSDFNQFSVIE